MSNLIRSSSHVALQSLKSPKIDISLSHVREIVAALLGYRTYAAVTAEEKNPDIDLHLDDAEIIVFNRALGLQRIQQLNCSSLIEEDINNSCIAALRAAWLPNKMYDGISDFYDNYCHHEMGSYASSDDEIFTAMADCNAEFGDDLYMNHECLPSADLWKSDCSWSIEADGTIEGEHDIESDRMFTGNIINCRVRFNYTKAGRAGLIYDDAVVYAGLNDSWRGDPDGFEIDDEPEEPVSES